MFRHCLAGCTIGEPFMQEIEPGDGVSRAKALLGLTAFVAIMALLVLYAPDRSEAPEKPRLANADELLAYHLQSANYQFDHAVGSFSLATLQDYHSAVKNLQGVLNPEHPDAAQWQDDLAVIDDWLNIEERYWQAYGDTELILDVKFQEEGEAVLNAYLQAYEDAVDGFYALLGNTYGPNHAWVPMTVQGLQGALKEHRPVVLDAVQASRSFFDTHPGQWTPHSIRDQTPTEQHVLYPRDGRLEALPASADLAAWWIALAQDAGATDIQLSLQHGTQIHYCVTTNADGFEEYCTGPRTTDAYTIDEPASVGLLLRDASILVRNDSFTRHEEVRGSFYDAQGVLIRTQEAPTVNAFSVRSIPVEALTESGYLVLESDQGTLARTPYTVLS